MATVRIPLASSFNQRGIDGTEALISATDQRYLNCSFDVVTNPFTGASTVYVSKRPGWGVDSIVAAGSPSTALIKPQSFLATLTAFGATNSTIYWGQTSVGAITGLALHMTETIVSGVNYVMIKSSDGTGWYYADGAKDVTAYTADGNNSTTITDIKIAGANSTAGLYPGQLLSAATNIVAGTRIVSVDSGAYTAVLDTATTDGAFSDLAITKTPIAKILDSDFITTGTVQSAFVEMNGYLFYVVDATGKLYNSNINSITAYTSIDFLSPNLAPDPPIAIARHQDKIIVFGASSREVYQDVANKTGSPLERIPQYFSNVGVLNQRSITRDGEDNIYFVSSASTGDIGVYQLHNLQATRISTPQIDRILGTSSATGGDIYANVFRLGGYTYLSLYISNTTTTSLNILLETSDAMLLEDANNLLLEGAISSTTSFVRNLVYNVELKIWSEWDSSIPTFTDGSSSNNFNQIFATSRSVTDGKVYTISPISQGNLYQDDGVNYTTEIRTAKIDLGTSKRKRIHSIRLICDADATGTCTLEWSDDDYATWSTARSFDLTSKEPKLPACGSHKGYRAYRLTHTGNAPFRAEALEIEYESEDNKVRRI